MREISNLILFVLLITLLAACNPEATLVETDPQLTEEGIMEATEQESSPSPTSTKTPERPTIPIPSQVPTWVVTAEPEAFIMDEELSLKLAKKTLAEKLSIDQDLIAVVSIMEAEWPDTSLECPEKGLFYIQVLVPGFKVVLEVNGQEYDVHIGDGRTVICVDGQPID
ncbi:MAG: hypothetical protein A2Z14_03260 [Chloroflexi bacterium RBG_16_48_8]|nr:MAG: hypothetical protein A2Z14_03260 [Chloroflexi bacterium RBG_16_48_8]